MEFLSPIASIVLPGVALLLLAVLLLRLRQRAIERRSQMRDALDTVAAWPPDAVRVLTIDERQAYEVLRRAMPGFLVLAQVPISRFVRVPTRHSYSDWLQRVGSISADLLVCDAGSRVLAVVDIRSAQETARGHRRHERLKRVLESAGVQVYTWREGRLPSVSEARIALAQLNTNPAPLAPKAPARVPQQIPVPEITELLAEGDERAQQEASLEPVPSGFYDEIEAAATSQR